MILSAQHGPVHQKLQQRLSVQAMKRSGDSLKQATLDAFIVRVVTDSTTSATTSLQATSSLPPPQKRRKTASAPGTAQRGRAKLSNSKDIAKVYSPSIQNISASQPLDQGSTSRGQVCARYSTWFSKEKSEGLWLSTETDFANLNSIYSDLSSPLLVQRSQWRVEWMLSQRKTCPRTSCQLSPSLVPSTMEEDDTSDEKKRTLKVRMYPNRNQKKILKRWLGASRFLYNKALARVNEGDKPTFGKLRNALLNSEEWLKEIPNAVQQGGIHQLAQAFKTNFSKMKKNNSKKGFTVRFRSRKHLKTEVISKLDKRTTTFLIPAGKTIQLSFMRGYLETPLLLVDSERAIQKIEKWKRPPCGLLTLGCL